MSEALRTLEVIGTYGGAMLSIINAAEAQFRHESETRMREHAILVSIRERRAAQSTASSIAPRSTPTLALETPTVKTLRPATRVARAEWPRPIGVKNCEGTVCAVA